MVSFFAWLGAVGYGARIAAAMPFCYQSPNAIPLEHTLTAFLSSVLAGASRFAHAGWLRYDKALHAMLGIAYFPGEDAIRRFFHQFTQARIEAFWRPLWIWLLGLLAQPADGFTLDMDSTIFNREDSQQGAAKGYNPRRSGRKSHHPLLAVLAEAPFVLHAWLRSGNTAAGRGGVAFLSEALALLPHGWKLRCVRADSGFFDKTPLGLLEERAIAYIVVARLSGWDRDLCFLVVREEKAAVGRKLIDVPGSRSAFGSPTAARGRWRSGAITTREPPWSSASRKSKTTSPPTASAPRPFSPQRPPSWPCFLPTICWLFTKPR